MSRKPKFRPVITRVRLNPEQAVLACGCYDNKTKNQTASSTGKIQVCVYSARGIPPKGHCGANAADPETSSS